VGGAREGPGSGGGVDRTPKSGGKADDNGKPATGKNGQFQAAANKQTKELAIIAVDIESLGLYLSEEDAHKALNYTRSLVSLYADDLDMENMDSEIYGTSSPLGASSSGLTNAFDDDDFSEDDYQ
jgi:hypothetical protein